MVVVKFLRKEGFGYKFLLKDVRCDFVASLRRCIINHVPTFSVHKIVVLKNESVMSDEMLAQRIGLIPIYSSEIDDKEHKLYIKKTGGTVYSGDIQEDGFLESPLKKIPIVVLGDNKTLELELNVKLGIGNQHIKYSPASVFFNNVPFVKQHEENIDSEFACPKHLFEKRANKVFLKDATYCDVCRYCEEKTKGAIELEFKDDEFIFTIEPFGNLDISNIFESAADYLNKTLEELKTEIKLIDENQHNSSLPKKKKEITEGKEPVKSKKAK